MSSRNWPANRCTPADLVPWVWPLKVYVNIAGAPPMTPLWVVVELNEPSGLIAIVATLMWSWKG